MSNTKIDCNKDTNPYNALIDDEHEIDTQIDIEDNNHINEEINGTLATKKGETDFHFVEESNLLQIHYSNNYSKSEEKCANLNCNARKYLHDDNQKIGDDYYAESLQRNIKILLLQDFDSNKIQQ